MENTVKKTTGNIELIVRVIFIMLMVAGGISLLFWGSFVFTFVLNVIVGGPKTDLVRWGFDLLYNNSTFSFISFIFAGIVVFILIKMDNKKK